jgi:hypothetical protein
VAVATAQTVLGPVRPRCVSVGHSDRATAETLPPVRDIGVTDQQGEIECTGVAAGVVTRLRSLDGVIGRELKPDDRRRLAFVEVALNRVSDLGVQILEAACLGEDRISQGPRGEASLGHSLDEKGDSRKSGTAFLNVHRTVSIARSGWDPARSLGVRVC